MTTPFSDEILLEALQAWDLSSPLLAKRLPSGFTSQVWKVETGKGSFIAKYAYQAQAAFEGGLHAAELAATAGIRSGLPLRTKEGALSILTEAGSGESHPLALLHFVPGEPLDFSEPDAASLYGHLLGQTHSLLLDRLNGRNLFDLFDFLLGEEDYVRAQPGLAPLISQAITAFRGYEAQEMVTYGVIWADRVEILREKETAQVGIIDWGAIERGPLLFDVALSILWLFPLGTKAHDEFLQSYLAVAPIFPSELDGLNYSKVLFWARQAKYFAYRIAANVSIGDRDPDGNAKRFQQARHQLERLLSSLEKDAF